MVLMDSALNTKPRILEQKRFGVQESNNLAFIQ